MPSLQLESMKFCSYLEKYDRRILPEKPCFNFLT